MELRINGELVQVDVEPDMPLLWVLRDVVGLRGTKYGCGISACGACTVLVDGEPMRSCVMAVGSVNGKGEITTIEGLAHDGVLSAVQEAWVEKNVPQCGYCQSGQILAAHALLKAKNEPTDDDINGVLAGNLCRCGTYPDIRDAIKLAATKRTSS